MMQALTEQFECIEHTLAASDDASMASVDEMLLLFGTSARSPALAYRLHIPYEAQCASTAASAGSSASDATMQSIRRHVMRQMIGFAEQLYPDKLPNVMRSQFLLDHFSSLLLPSDHIRRSHALVLCAYL